ncbi:MAG TPA: response regulator [Roseomonas sp.]|nr:response regulator [Roseomonas sp.]
MAAMTECRVLVVEDEEVIAAALDDTLQGVGAVVLGPVGSVREALALLERERPAAAVLDLNLHGEMAGPLMDALARRAIPFVVGSGYAGLGLPERHQAAPLLTKPYGLADMVMALWGVLRGSGKVVAG